MLAPAAVCSATSRAALQILSAVCDTEHRADNQDADSHVIINLQL